MLQIGWYPDPSRPGTERYWDGTEWTEECRPEVIHLSDWTTLSHWADSDLSDLAESEAGTVAHSTVGFELPSEEVLARMGAGAGSGAGMPAAADGEGSRTAGDAPRGLSGPTGSRRPVLPSGSPD